jgi:capsular exopolysaccharide synthesis family protein
MSRIHEALKKAAQERTAQLAAAVDGDVSEVSVEISSPVTTVPSSAGLVGQHRVFGDSGQAGPFTYEELVKRCSQPKWGLDVRPSIFQGSSAENGGAERFRTLRSRLYQIAGTRTLRRLLITSSVAKEGKTFVTANLAQSIVQQAERRVLLIDGDLRASQLHSVMGAPRRPGLTDYLRGQLDAYGAIQRGTQENLFLISAGSEAPNPSELLLSERMKNLLDLVTPIFDWILIDSPPALPVHDASILADMADGVLLVVRAGTTDAVVAEKVAGEFREKKLLGVVLNRVEKADSYSSYYYPSCEAEIQKQADSSL